MNDYSDNMNMIQNKALYSIEEEYKEMISAYRRKINAKIQYCIEDTFRGIPDGKIEDWIDELFIDDFKIIEKQNFNKIEQVLDDYKHKIPRGLEDGVDLSRLINNYQEELKDILKKHNLYNLEDLISDFSRQISSKISYYLEVFKGISGYNIDNKIDELKYSIKRRLETVMSEYYEEYNFQIVNILNRNIKSIQENVQEIEKPKQIPQEIIDFFEENMIYSGYKLIIENNKIYAQELKTKESIELKYNKKTNELYNEQFKINFSIVKDSYVSEEQLKDKTIIVGDNYIATYYDIFESNFIQISKTSKGYEFKYGIKEIEDLSKIGIIISELKERSPEYYKKLLLDEDFIKIIEKTKEHNEQIKEIIYDENTQQVKLNSQTKEIFKQKIKLMGYEAVEKEDGMYLEDLITKEVYKINYNYGLFKIPELGIIINTNINFTTPKTIISNVTRITKGDNNLVIQDLNRIRVDLGAETYGIKIEEDKIKYTSKNNLTEEEIIERIKKEFPFLIEYTKQKAKESKKEERQENIEELKMMKSNILRAAAYALKDDDIISMGPKR